jgi:hypothetical protein
MCGELIVLPLINVFLPQNWSVEYCFLGKKDFFVSCRISVIGKKNQRVLSKTSWKFHITPE